MLSTTTKRIGARRPLSAMADNRSISSGELVCESCGYPFDATDDYDAPTMVVEYLGRIYCTHRCAADAVRASMRAMWAADRDAPR